jgi:hypothetical protein
MTKRISKQLNSFKYKGEPIKITLGTLILTALCVLLLIVATFTQITLTHLYLPLDWMNYIGQGLSENEIIQHFTKTYRYIPQIPVVFLIIALLGRKFGILAILLYITLGMFFPIFALGGGVTYLFEYGFGYIGRIDRNVVECMPVVCEKINFEDAVDLSIKKLYVEFLISVGIKNDKTLNAFIKEIYDA